VHVPGYWRSLGWVRAYFRHPEEPRGEQLEIPLPRDPVEDSAEQVAEEVRDRP